jgi:hypothetical protein
MPRLFNFQLLVGLLTVVTACQSGNPERVRQAERAVQAAVKRRVEKRGAIYAPLSVKTQVYGKDKERWYQVTHAYTITVDKGETMNETGVFFVDSVGAVREYGRP